MRWRSRFLDGIFHAEAFALDDDGLRVVQQTVEHGGRERGVVVEDFGPFAVDAIGGDDGGAALVALADDLEQQVGADFVDGQVAEFIQLC